MKVTDLTVLEGLKLHLRFEDGTQGVADLSDLAGRGVMKAWDDRSEFAAARITEQGAVEWPGEIDLCGDSLYLRATGKQAEELFPRLSSMSDA